MAKSKNKPRREPRKEAALSVPPEAAEREAARLLVCVRASDDRYREYWETLDPRQQALMPKP
jgi:hypothetical protein